MNPYDKRQEDLVLRRVRNLAARYSLDLEECIMFQRTQMRLGREIQRSCFEIFLRDESIIPRQQNVKSVSLEEMRERIRSLDEQTYMEIGKLREIIITDCQLTPTAVFDSTKEGAKEWERFTNELRHLGASTDTCRSIRQHIYRILTR